MLKILLKSKHRKAENGELRVSKKTQTMSSYKTGTTAPDISLNVDVDTIGTAATRVSKRPTGSSGGGIAVAHSVDATGDVTNAHLGGAASLSGNTLTIATSINLFGDEDEREKEFERIS